MKFNLKNLGLLTLFALVLAPICWLLYTGFTEYFALRREAEYWKERRDHMADLVEHRKLEMARTLGHELYMETKKIHQSRKPLCYDEGSAERAAKRECTPT